MQNETLAEKLLYSTVKVVAKKGNAVISTGTGFLFNFLDKTMPCLVTNNHVLVGADMLHVRLHLRRDDHPSGETVDCAIGLTATRLYRHPTADLCAVAIAPVLLNVHNQGRLLRITIFDSSFVPMDDEWESFDSLEEVIMIGCPNGLTDEINNLPIVRRGITATSVTKLYNGKPEFMVDMACFPGSSGSPIIIFNKGGYYDRDSNTLELSKVRIKLVGILYSGPLITASGKIILAHAPHVEVSSMMHLGYAIRSSELMVLDTLLRGVIETPEAGESANAP
jgi:hypothetical protein